MEITREQSDTAAESYARGSYATGDDIMAGMVLTKDGKLDYPKPPPKSLSVASSKSAGNTAAAAARTGAKPATPPGAGGGGLVQTLLWAVLGGGGAAVLAVVIAPDSPFFVGNVMIFVLASVLGCDGDAWTE